MLPPVLITPPSDTPVSLSEVKGHCRVDHNDDDAVLEALLAAAVDHLDGWTGILGRCIVSQTWRQDFPSFGCMRLALGPVKSIASVTYYDADNAQQTLSSDIYTLLTGPLGDYVVLKPDQSWPEHYSRPDAVSVTYEAGAEPEDVPAAIKAAILLLVAHWYENRGAAGEGGMAELPFAVSALIAPYRRTGV